LVTLTARIGWPLSDLPIDTSLAILGNRAAVAVTSSRIPPASLYERKADQPCADCSRSACEAVLPSTFFGDSFTPLVASFRAW
jgi:hypothetical protein